MKTSQWLGVLLIAIPFTIMGYGLVMTMGWKTSILVIVTSLLVVSMIVIGAGLLSGDIG